MFKVLKRIGIGLAGLLVLGIVLVSVISTIRWNEGYENFNIPVESISIGGALQGWSQADFITAMRTGVTPSGHNLSEAMPWRYLGQMIDEELQAIWLYLQSLPALEQGTERTDL